MLVGGYDLMPDMARRPEGFLVAALNLLATVFLTLKNFTVDLNIGVSHGRVTGLFEEGRVDSWAILHILCQNVSRTNHDLFRVLRSRVDASYLTKKGMLAVSNYLFDSLTLCFLIVTVITDSKWWCS